ncbi:MAG: zf-TFIIB domain-containing protein [Planctomycetota bacterium]
MLCPGCGNEIDPGEECPVCAAGRHTKRAPSGPPERKPPRTRLCPGCGNEIEPGGACPVCAAGRNVRRSPATPAMGELASHLCPSCGNEIYGEGPCGICNSGHAIRKNRKRGWSLCPRCGNEVEDVHDCPICREGRAPGGSPRREGVVCPQCDEAMEQQDWEDVRVHICGSCQGCFFPPDGLEQTLDKLRDESEASDVVALLAEYRERNRLSLPRAVRYKPCPVCGQAMVRRNYASTSGVIVEVCGHGVWVDQSAFGALSDFVSRGGDRVAERRATRRR